MRPEEAAKSPMSRADLAKGQGLKGAALGLLFFFGHSGKRGSCGARPTLFFLGGRGEGGAVGPYSTSIRVYHM